MAEAVAVQIDRTFDGARRRPRISHQPAPVDLATAEAAATEMLAALGLPIDSEDMFETPRRLVHAYAEMLTPPEFDSTTFDNAAGYDELVLVSDIPVHSLCEHHLLPFTGVAHVGYLPDTRILGLSKFARTVEFFARRAQTQERLTTEIAEHLTDRLDPLGVGVVIEAEHTCMSLRGARAEGARTVTAALHGRMRDDPKTRAEFLSLTRNRAIRSGGAR
ncbi:MAG TPA: GTP cyclohydrolase I [Nocardioides sp.]|jgi:GTP cyclohydrolase I|nr:GTP cyclohydrolase I [Nocardioides sp.]